MIFQKNIIALYFYLFISISASAAPPELPGDSLFHLNSKWTTQAGKEIHLKDLRGKKSILTMVYLSCGFSCPTIISAVEGLSLRLDEKAKANTQNILVSFDSERDNPAAMLELAKKRDLDLKQWVMLSSRKDSTIRELAAALNFKYQKAGSDFTHSFMIVVLNEDGVVTARIDSASQDKAPLIAALQRK